MAYSDFSFQQAVETFNLVREETVNLFADVEGVAPSPPLAAVLDDNIRLATAINTEKARSEFLIAPILADVCRRFRNEVNLFSGVEFTVDPERGLLGYCDFILSRSSEQYFVTAPAVTIVEAKNENLKSGFGQCVAEMVAARIFNERAGKLTIIHGVVTTGTNWRFFRLDGDRLFIDPVEYHVGQVEKILGNLVLTLKKND